MPPTDHSRLCNRDLAGVGVFARSRYVISVVRICNSLCGVSLLLSFACIKLFSFIKSIDIRST